MVRTGHILCGSALHAIVRWYRRSRLWSRRADYHRRSLSDQDEGKGIGIVLRRDPGRKRARLRIWGKNRRRFRMALGFLSRSASRTVIGSVLFFYARAAGEFSDDRAACTKGLPRSFSH